MKMTHYMEIFWIIASKGKGKRKVAHEFYSSHEAKETRNNVVLHPYEGERERGLWNNLENSGSKYD